MGPVMSQTDVKYHHEQHRCWAPGWYHLEWRSKRVRVQADTFSLRSQLCKECCLQGCALLGWAARNRLDRQASGFTALLRGSARSLPAKPERPPQSRPGDALDPPHVKYAGANRQNTRSCLQSPIPLHSSDHPSRGIVVTGDPLGRPPSASVRLHLPHVSSSQARAGLARALEGESASRLALTSP